MKTCNKCPCLKWENWEPKPAIAARCMNEYRPRAGITPHGRVLDIFRHGKKLPVHRPAWCPYNGERRLK